MKRLISILITLISISFAQIENVRIDQNANQPNEVSIAINPLFPDIIAAGSNLKYFYQSYDGGKTWSEKDMESSLGVWGDPSLIYDKNGHLYFGHLRGYGWPNDNIFLDRIVVQKSTNNGLTWNDGASVGTSQVGKDQDKEWLASDMSSNSLYYGNVYMSSHQVDL